MTNGEKEEAIDGDNRVDVLTNHIAEDSQLTNHIADDSQLTNHITDDSQLTNHIDAQRANELLPPKVEDGKVIQLSRGTRQGYSLFTSYKVNTVVILIISHRFFLQSQIWMRNFKRIKFTDLILPQKWDCVKLLAW